MCSNRTGNHDAYYWKVFRFFPLSKTSSNKMMHNITLSRYHSSKPCLLIGNKLTDIQIRRMMNSFYIFYFQFGNSWEYGWCRCHDMTMYVTRLFCVFTDQLEHNVDVAEWAMKPRHYVRYSLLDILDGECSSRMVHVHLCLCVRVWCAFNESRIKTVGCNILARAQLYLCVHKIWCDRSFAY